MRPRRAAIAVTLCLAGFGGVCNAAGTARADGLSAAVADCNAHGTLVQSYTADQLRAALATMPADIAEYTDCHDVIERQLTSQLGQVHGSGEEPGGGGSFIPTGVAALLVLLGLAAAAFAGLVVRQRSAA